MLDAITLAYILSKEIKQNKNNIPSLNKNNKKQNIFKNKKIINIIGWVGSISLFLAYCLLSYDLLSSKDIRYHILNLIGGFCLGYRVWVDKNYSNFILEIFFIFVAIKSIIQNI